MLNKHVLGALTASILLVAASAATAQVVSTVSVALDASDPVWNDRYFASGQPCVIDASVGSRYFEIVQINVAASGTYQLIDKFDPVDAGIGIYSGTFNPLSPNANCVATSEDNVSASLAAGTYTVVISSLFPDRLGRATYQINGPAAVTVISAAPVPTMSEWAMILFGAILAGGTAHFIQRRRPTV